MRYRASARSTFVLAAITAISCAGDPRQYEVTGSTAQAVGFGSFDTTKRRGPILLPSTLRVTVASRIGCDR